MTFFQEIKRFGEAFCKKSYKDLPAPYHIGKPLSFTFGTFALLQDGHIALFVFQIYSLFRQSKK